MINAFDFKGAKAMLPRAVVAARATAAAGAPIPPAPRALSALTGP